MTLSGEPSTFETRPVPPQRAGLRVAPAPGQPTGLFEVIEMAVLVIVTALAMVSVIVAGGEDDSRERVRASIDRAQSQPPARHDRGPDSGSLERRRPTDAIAAR